MRSLVGFARIVALLVVIVPAGVWANSSGVIGTTLRPGDSGGGCVGCHGSAGVVSTQVSGSNVLLPGATTRINFTVSGITNPAAKVGINGAITKDAVNQPTFAVVAGEPEGLSDSNTQARHSNFEFALKTPVNGSASYPFDLTMPAGAVLGSTYTIYAVGNAGRSATQVGWNHAANFVITVAPPTPTSLSANQAAATASSVPLSWAGTQGEHFRVLRKTGSYPSSATDGTATLVYEGNLTSQTATGLSAGTQYFFAAFGKAPTSAFYSSQAAQATAGTIPANPTSLTANATSSSEVSLSWAGTSAQFRVLRKIGAYPTGPTDGAAALVYEGNTTQIVDSGLQAGTDYFYRVWGKVAGLAVYSTGNAQQSVMTSADPTTRHVSSANGDDGAMLNDCADPGAPCRTITHAMQAAGSGDTILVQPGVHDIALGEVFPISMKHGVQLISAVGPEQTFIDGAGDPVQEGLIFSSGNNSMLTRIEGFTLRNGLNTPEQGGVALGGALNIQTGNTGLFTLARNVFSNNEARGYSADGTLGETAGLAWGGAISVFSALVDIENCVFVSNLARGGNALNEPGVPLSNNENGGQARGGAIYFSGSGSVVNNSFYANRAIGGDGGLASNGVGLAGAGSGGAITASGAPTPSFFNNVFMANEARVGGGGIDEVASGGALLAQSPPANENNLFFGNLVDGAASIDDDLGSSAVLADPLFHAAPSNLRLRNSSPGNDAGVDAAAPDTDLDGQARPNPPSIGAFESSFVAQAIVFGNPPTVSAGGSASVAVSGGASGNPVVLGSSTPSICSPSGLMVNGLAAGECTLLASQEGNDDFSAAPGASLSFQVLATPSFSLDVSLSGNGSVLSTPAGIDCGEVCSANFVDGTDLSLTAVPDAGFAFSGWSGDCGGIDECNLGMSQNRAVTANFEPLTSFAVSISGAQEVPPTAVEGSGFGVAVINTVNNTLTYDFQVSGLSGTLTGAHFHGPASRGVNAGVKINIGAAPFQGSVSYNQVDEADLLGGQWYVNYHTVANSGGEIRGQLDNLGGVFALVVSRSGTGGGVVTSSPNGIDCGGVCLAAFNSSSQVTLTAQPDLLSQFEGWSGDCSGSDPVCVLTLDQTRSATARFGVAQDAPVLIFSSGFEP